MNSDKNRLERDHLLSLKRVVKPELARLEALLLFHKPHDNDQDFDDFIRKAVYYRDILKRIEADLAKLSE